MATLPVWPPASVPWATTMSQPGLDRGDGVADLAAHVHDEHVAAVAEVDDVAGHAQPGDEHRAAAVDDVVDLGGHVAGRGGEQVDAERLVGELADLGDLVAHLLGAHGGRAHAAEAAGLATGGHEAVVRHPAHAGQHHRVLDLQDVGQSGAHGRMARARLTGWSSTTAAGRASRDTSGGMRCPGHADMATPPRVPWAQLRLGGPPVEVGGPIGLTRVNLGGVRFGPVAPPVNSERQR